MQKKISYGGITTALCVILLLMSTYLPSGKACALFLSSLLVLVLVEITDKKTALISYAASSLIGIFLGSSSSPLAHLSFFFCFGNYPILLHVLANKKVLFQIISKFVLYCVYFTLIFLTLVYVYSVTIPLSPILIFFVGLGAFVFYDYLLQRTGNYIMIRFFKSL